MMIKNKNYFRLMILIFYFNLLFSNEIYLESTPQQNELLKIYYNSSDSVIPEYIFPVHIMIKLYDVTGKSLNQIKNTMVRAYWKGEDWWLFEFIVPKSAVNADVRFSASNLDLDCPLCPLENFTFNCANAKRFMAFKFKQMRRRR